MCMQPQALLKLTAARSRLRNGFSRVWLSGSALPLRMCMLPALSVEMTLQCHAQIDCCGTTMKAYAPRNETFCKTSALSVTTTNGKINVWSLRM